jgi:hypothetical protein
VCISFSLSLSPFGREKKGGGETKANPPLFIGGNVDGLKQRCEFYSIIERRNNTHVLTELKSSAYSHLLDLEHPLVATNMTRTPEK